MFGRLFGRSYCSTSAQAKQSSPESSSAILHTSDPPSDPDRSTSFIPVSSELPRHLREIVLPAPLLKDAFDPPRHMRIVVAQDPFSQSARTPLFDSHPSRDSSASSVRRNAFGSYSSMDSAEAGSYTSTTSNGSSRSISSHSPLEPALFPGPPPESPSFYRLVDHMFGNVPMSYKGASVKMRPLNTTESPDRKSFLVTKLFSVSTHEPPSVRYSAGATIADGVPIYPKIYVDSPSQSSFNDNAAPPGFLPAEHEWVPTPAAGDSLPVARSKGLFFAIGVIVSIPRDQQSLLSANWTAFSRALDEFARVVHAELQDAVLTQAARLRQCRSSVDGFSMPVTAQQLRISPLTTNENVRASAVRFIGRFASGLSVPRVRCGISKWDIWREEARRLDSILSNPEKKGSTYLEIILASFLGADTDWLETFGFVNPLFEDWKSKRVMIAPSRTIVTGDNHTTQRILYLLAAFLPAGASANQFVVHKSSPAASPGPCSLTSHKVGRAALDIPGRRQPLRLSMTHYDSHSNLQASSSVASYISSIWSQPSSVTTALTSSTMSAKDGLAISSEAAISDAVSYSSSSAELDLDADFFGPWDDVSGSPISVGCGPSSLPGSLTAAALGNMTVTSYDMRPRYSITSSSESGETILDVAISPHYADLRVPSLSSSVNRTRPSSGVKFDLPQLTSTSHTSSSSVDVTGISSFFHPEFKLQSCPAIEDGNVVLRALIEDSEYGQVPITQNSWTIVSRALVIDVDAKSVIVWNVLRRLSEDSCTLLQQVVKTAPVRGGCDLARMWDDERLSQTSTPSCNPNMPAKEIVENVLSEIIDAAGKHNLRTGISQMMLGSIAQELAI
ncbi:hypothetical protein V1520DRAFT_337744 [Lipomyces starkeyi]|uniref:Folliculin-interacting protein N-terminal domain-containing protein n=1 Tax=Lipomyces starkeyi NRRL Y-11557 TaxID=675824 RepID=A0A1E3Q0M6_LIPST|nr:hypothetical protein LIPSTDRAFT_148715 [Lipomyces starkeyi NRRL Y-11557]